MHAPATISRSCSGKRASTCSKIWNFTAGSIATNWKMMEILVSKALHTVVCGIALSSAFVVAAEPEKQDIPDRSSWSTWACGKSRMRIGSYSILTELPKMMSGTIPHRKVKNRRRVKMKAKASVSSCQLLHQFGLDSGRRIAWAELNAEQQQVLAGFEDDWASLPPQRRRACSRALSAGPE